MNKSQLETLRAAHHWLMNHRSGAWWVVSDAVRNAIGLFLVRSSNRADEAVARVAALLADEVPAVVVVEVALEMTVLEGPALVEYLSREDWLGEE